MSEETDADKSWHTPNRGPNFDTFAVDVMDALTYIKEHEKTIFIRAQVNGKWKSQPLSEATPDVWARYVHTWMKAGQMPVRFVGDQESSPVLDSVQRILHEFK